MRLIKKYGFLNLLRSMVKRKGNFNVLLIGFGTRDEEEAEKLRRELEEVETAFQKWM